MRAGHRVVARRPGHHEGHALAAFLERLEGRQPRPGRPPGGVEGLGAGEGVAVDVAAPRPAEGVQLVEMNRSVDSGQLGVGGQARRNPQEVGRQVEVLDALEHGVDAGGPLGMAAPLVDVPAHRAGHDQHGGAPPRVADAVGTSIGKRTSTSSRSLVVVTG